MTLWTAATASLFVLSLFSFFSSSTCIFLGSLSTFLRLWLCCQPRWTQQIALVWRLTETTLWLFCLARLDAKMTLVAAGVDILYPKEGSKIIKSEQETIYLIVGKDQRLKQLRDKWKIKVAGVQATRSKTQSWRKYIYLVEVHRMQRSCERCKTRMKSLARLRFYKRISIGWKAVNRSISSSGRVRFLNLKIARSGLMDASPLCRIVVNQDGQQCSYESPRFQIL